MKNATWIKYGGNEQIDAPIFRKKVNVKAPVKKAVLNITARGVFEAYLNGEKIGNEYMAPGWTAFEERLQIFTYELKNLKEGENTLEVLLTKGWYTDRIAGLGANIFVTQNKKIFKRENGIIAELVIEYVGGEKEKISTDESWECLDGPVRFCSIYDGMVYDASFEKKLIGNASPCKNQKKSMLKKRISEPVVENEHMMPSKIIKTPKGETVIDFGQNMTGTLKVSLNAKLGDKLSVSFGEILDKDGNFYNGNYRTAECRYEYTCKDGYQSFMPSVTFYGFRYIRIDELPVDVSEAEFEAVVLHTKMEKTGEIVSSNPLLNRLVSNIFWGQKDNYLDIPTDCPQRDERLGWTGDAQIFVKAASYNFDVLNFFKKWLEDIKVEQRRSGEIPPVIPAAHDDKTGAAWGDVVTIVPWQMYLTYGDKGVLENMFPAMRKWIDFITNITTTPYLWTGYWQFGDWCELNAPWGEVKGKTRDDLVASAYYAYSTQIVVKAGKILGEDVSEYEKLYNNIVATYKNEYKDTFYTQTEHIITLHFGLTDNPQSVADSLARLIKAEGTKLQTGFVGTPYILHALSKYGYSELAYELLLKTDYPSWLYPVTKGATTIWEHWDGIMPDGRIWPDTMNSYNHYAYGAVADWMYEVAAGINTVEEAPGFKEIIFRPMPTHKLDSFGASIKTAYGKVSSRWWHEGSEIRYEIITPSPAKAYIGGKEYTLSPGTYRF